MTNEQFEIICAALADKIHGLQDELKMQDTTIYLQGCEIKELKAKLEEAEKYKEGKQ